MSDAEPRCEVCELPMNAELTLTLGWTTHPACDPEYTAEVRRQATAAKEKE